jgi:hypothetical protein
VDLSLRYIRGKIAFEERLKASLAYKVAKLRRCDAMILNFCDSSMWGLAAEAMERGFDKAGVINDFAASRPCSDALDLGSDLINSEVLNTFLNAADITESGVVTEEVLRKVYDAYAHTVSKMFTERYAEPGAKGSSVWYVWHIINDRHMFLRRAILGYPKVRVASAGQREADFDEAFDQDLRTTGFSRRLKNACNGQTTCDHVKERLAHNPALGHLFIKWFPLRSGGELSESLTKRGSRVIPTESLRLLIGLRSSFFELLFQSCFEIRPLPYLAR